MNILLDNIGELSPYIIFLLKIYILERHHINEFLYLILINIVINTILKYLIREKRPSIQKNYLIGKTYGMPSLHSQLSWFMLLYRINLKNNIIEQFTILCLCILTSIQRVLTNKHTIKQVIGGFITSLILMYFLNKYYIK